MLGVHAELANVKRSRGREKLSLNSYNPEPKLFPSNQLKCPSYRFIGTQLVLETHRGQELGENSR